MAKPPFSLAPPPPPTLRQGSGGSMTYLGSYQRMQKRAQEIRHLLCEHFHITEDPLHFIEGIGYKIRFKITRSPAYDT